MDQTEDNKRYHLIINVDEKYAIVNALAFYHAHHTLGALMDEDEREQYMLAFQEDGPTFVDSLATKVANTFWSLGSTDVSTVCKSQALLSTYLTQTMRDPNFIDEQRNADLLDAMADMAYEQEQAMRESEEFEWDGIEEISSAERNACDHYNERYVIND